MKTDVEKATKDSINIFLFNVRLLFQNILAESEENFSHKRPDYFLLKKG
jgi:hypothetical protein